jgi:electron transfer flavoprotein alpha subunit
MSIKVKEEKCVGCELCIDSCPYDAIVMKGDLAFINEYCQICNACIETCPEGAIFSDSVDEPGASANDITAYKGVWVFAEQREGKVSTVAYELLGAGRKLADDLGVGLAAVLIGGNNDEAQELIKWGAEKVYLAQDDSLVSFNDEPYTKILASLVRAHKPEIVLAGATAIGRSFVPRVATRLWAGLTADCTQLEVDKETRHLDQIRPAFGGNIMATILTPNTRPQMATVRPRVMKPLEYDASRTGEVIAVSTDNITSRTKVLQSVKEESETAVNLQEAQIIVSGGRGLGNPEAFKMLEELAELLDGTVGASRAAVDEGWIPYRHQVGQTGKTVCPKIYISCGISGAVQHLVGMQSSDTIIAINKNPDAPIFNAATYGVVGDLNEVVPALIRKLKSAKGVQ